MRRRFERLTAFAVAAIVWQVPACARRTVYGSHEQVTATAPTAPTAPTTVEARPRAPDVPYEPSPEHVVAQMMGLARLVSGDVLYDLGCGDGRIVIAAVKQHGVRGVCVDIDPVRIAESRENARRAGVNDRITFLTQDLFETDIRDATVVTLFLWPKVNLELRPKLFRELRPGARVISYMHDMGDWAPDETVPVHSGTRETAVYLWKMPERSGKEK